MKDVHEKYKDDVKVVFRHFPIPSHEGAFEAAEASMCANDQDKFWEFHDKIFDAKGKFDKETFVSVAKEIGLDGKEFSECYDSHKYKDKVEKDRMDGEKAGVSGTPAFYINKRMVSGARDVEYFSDLISRELARK
jgi:protein-disulfide isomerase